MLNTKRLLAAFGKDFPKHLAKRHHDYVGLMCGKLPLHLHHVAIVLDLEAIDLTTILNLKPDLILTHHPFIYGQKKKVLSTNPIKKNMVEALEKANIPVYSLHTNFDEGQGGMNDALANKLLLKDIKPLSLEPLGRGGLLEKPMTIDAFAAFAKEALGVPYGFLIAEGKPMIQSVAIIGGGGARDYPYAMQEGYDIFISGDAPHHVRRSIVNDHYNYLELPHEIEHIFLDTMAAYIRRLDPSMKIFSSIKQTLPRII
jgi:dinuclear metal center YbgI/SA1388 family protein